MIVYNIEEFVIQQMFRPYQNLFPDTATPEDIIKWEQVLRKEPTRIMSVLLSDDKLYELVFNRLAKMKVTFYKWLNHPIIGAVEHALGRRCIECGDVFSPNVKYYPNRVCSVCLHKASSTKKDEKESE